MSWVFRFELQGGDRPVPVAVRRKAGLLLQRTLRKLQHIGLVVLAPNDDEPLVGEIQIFLRDGAEASFASLLAMLQQLAREEPGTSITAADDFYLGGRDVLTVGTPDEVLAPDHTHGTGVFRSGDQHGQSVYRDLPSSIDALRVVASFLNALSAQRLIVWCGPKDDVLEALAELVDAIAGGRWRGAEDVLRVLEADDSVEEIFATDPQIDAAWREAIRHA